MEKIKVKCKNCGYEWETTSKLIMISCPSCMKKTQIREFKKIK